ncbi:peptidyl-prolyl cis-trans isomerase FKBP17-1, chloroplastic-like [Physcomitrium patens]|uniref:peptidylprolyl isomerase n=1 Tax=Physcomitrium patens TaxID=3218 RepID=A0A2K1KZT8_PHYPA|nr:peptidyl-prolyl cis-trans isomerase FKBP17-1, chloroplastic-like [Physcomitrium patens]PNR59289.1 hypothetical protein PHYPA_002080 [Physcomitrium patens]|eukprot:XP_024399542.1 peptidyl-prolyl cis-trans isomerase FKBP17-1, chloroplastic-like [Physcomitrella patens]
MAMLSLGAASSLCNGVLVSCSRTARSRSSIVTYSPTCSVNPECQELSEPVSRRSVLLRAGCGAGIVTVSLVSGAGIGECAAKKEKVREPPPKFYELEGSSGVKALDIRQGMGAMPEDGDQVEVHYYGRLGAKQGWRFDSTYDHKDFFGNPEPYVFILGDKNVISGINSAVRSMKEGGVRRVVIPPSQGYQNTNQGPIPPDYFDRQRLYTTIFNQTRLANGEGDTLGTLIFDIELLKVRKPQS